MWIRGKIALLLTGSAILLASACSSNEAGSAGEESVTPSPTEAVDSKECLEQQARIAFFVHPHVQTLTERVLSHRTATTARVLRSIRGVEKRTQGVCAGKPKALAQLRQLAEDSRARPVNEPALRDIIDAFKAWAATIGAPRDDRRILYVRDMCIPFHKHVHAYYEVRRHPEPGGVRVAVVLTVVNNWFEEVDGFNWGSLQATGVRPGGSTKTYRWGGSSADVAGAAPGHTHRIPVGLTATSPFLHLYPGGSVRVLKFITELHGCVIHVGPARP